MSDYRATREVLQAMLNKAAEKLVAARLAWEAGLYGEVASRSYYAVFHALSAVLAARGMTFSSHSQVLGTFNRELVKSGDFPRETSSLLQRLFEDRQAGDYSITMSLGKRAAEKDLADATGLLERCREYLEQQTGYPLKLSSPRSKNGGAGGGK